MTLEKVLINFCGGKACLTSFCSEVAESLLPPQGLAENMGFTTRGKPRGGGPGHARGLPETQMPDLLHHLGGWLERGQTAWHMEEAQENEFSLLSHFKSQQDAGGRKTFLHMVALD